MLTTTPKHRKTLPKQQQMFCLTKHLSLLPNPPPPPLPLSKCPPLLHRRNSRPKLIDSLGNVPLWILGDAQNGLPAREALAARRPLEPRAGLALAALELLPEQRLAGGRKEGERRRGPDEGVKVDVGPGADRLLEAEDEEGQRREGKGKLGDEVRGEVVVLFLGRGVARDGIEEKGADVPAEVWSHKDEMSVNVLLWNEQRGLEDKGQRFSLLADV